MWLKYIYFSITKQYKLTFEVSETKTFCIEDTAVLNSSKVKNQNESTPTPLQGGVESNYWGKKRKTSSVQEKTFYLSLAAPSAEPRPSEGSQQRRGAAAQLPSRLQLINSPPDSSPAPIFFFSSLHLFASNLSSPTKLQAAGVTKCFNHCRWRGKELIDDVWISQ